MLKPFRKVRSDDSVLRQLQDATSEAFQQIEGKEIIDGRLIEDLVFTDPTVLDPLATVSKLNIDHKLGREIKGYIIVKKDMEGDFWMTTTATPTKSFQLNITYVADITVSLWVF